MNSYAKTALIGVFSFAVAALILGTASLLDSRQANAKAEFAAQTGFPCGKCHQNPAGGGARKPFGDKFKENGFKVK